jgi:hypothetical protein
VDGIECGADAVQFAFFLVAVGRMQAARRGLAGAAEHDGGQNGANDGKNAAHGDNSHGKMEEFGRFTLKNQQDTLVPAR